jgi:hypothetical protein
MSSFLEQSLASGAHHDLRQRLVHVAAAAADVRHGVQTLHVQGALQLAVALALVDKEDELLEGHRAHLRLQRRGARAGAPRRTASSPRAACSPAPLSAYEALVHGPPALARSHRHLVQRGRGATSPHGWPAAAAALRGDRRVGAQHCHATAHRSQLASCSSSRPGARLGPGEHKTSLVNLSGLTQRASLLSQAVVLAHKLFSWRRGGVRCLLVPLLLPLSRDH